MKKNLLLGAMILAANSLVAADVSPKDAVKNAATALGNEANYTWRATVEVPEDAQFKPGPTDGQTEKNGYTVLTFNFGDNTTEGVRKGTNGAIETEDGWQTLADATKDSGDGGFNPTMFMARRVQNYKVPAVEAADLADATTGLTETNGVISGDLTEAGAKAQLAFGRANVSNAKGSVKFWITDGKLVKYQTHVTGTVSFGGNDNDVDNTTTVEIKNVGTTKVSVPDDAKKLVP